MLVGTVLAAAAVKPVAVAIVGVVVVALVLAAASAVRIRGHRAPRPHGADAGGPPGADGGGAEHAGPSAGGVQERWRRLAGDLDLEADLDAEIHGSLTTHAASSGTSSGAAAPVPRDRVDVDADATRFFAGPPADAEPATPSARPVQDPAPARHPDDATRLFGLEPEPAAWAPAQTRLFGPDGGVGNTPLLDDGYAVADHSADGPTGGLLALPPASTRVPQGIAPGGTDSRPASHALERVRDCLSTVATDQVMALSVIDSAGRVLAGTTDDDVTGELRSLMAESGLGNTADLVQPMRLANGSRGAMLLLPTGANALLGALVCDSGDLQATRARLRGVAHEIGTAMRAAS